MTEQLNSQVEYMIRANSFYNPLIPKAGIFLVGDKGIKFMAKSGTGFIQIPWTSIEQVRVQLFFGGRYVRGFFIDTDEDDSLEFVISDGKAWLRAMRKHLAREKFSAIEKSFQRLFRKDNQNNPT